MRTYCGTFRGRFGHKLADGVENHLELSVVLLLQGSPLLGLLVQPAAQQLGHGIGEDVDTSVRRELDVEDLPPTAALTTTGDNPFAETETCGRTGSNGPANGVQYF